MMKPTQPDHAQPRTGLSYQIARMLGNHFVVKHLCFSFRRLVR